ncbi:thermostable alpha-amylase [Polyplosphaeria fusca]|uniref:Thermostable alpha-amylase n=1 Tax=Polyplosphaeria fusca TaxID=682080 RepID=A0A9P4QLV8_9PLEO|nr:thermostable alpha-amylase [Polyplosphaeria fusca]
MPPRRLSDLVRWFSESRRTSFASPLETAQDQGNDENRCLFQGFEWHVPADQRHWKRLELALDGLKAIGVSEIWLPPGCKATHQNSNGYDIYDLYDLGEFEQKWHRSTKWGSKEDLIALSNKAVDVNMGLVWDAVLSHRAGGDHKEKLEAIEVDHEHRNRALSKPRQIEAWLNFDFSGRGDQYSSLKLHAEHFSGTDYDSTLQTQKQGVIYLTARSRRWSPNVDTSEKGNFDYLMFSNLDYASPDLCQDVMNWGVNFMPSTLPALSGYRIDAARHFDWKFLAQFLSAVHEAHPSRPWTFVAEYWQGSMPHLIAYLRKFPRDLPILAYDAPLLYALHNASSHLLAKGAARARHSPVDMRYLLKDTLVDAAPSRAVTLVGSHDTQPGQTLHCHTHPDFREAAYAIILLRQQGVPCVFYGDLYGIRAADGNEAFPPLSRLPDLMLARKLFAYGQQREYWDAPHCIGWTREGLQTNVPADKPWMGHGCAVIASNHGGGKKRMCVGKRHAGETWSGLWEWDDYQTKIEEDGWGWFEVGGVGMNVYVMDVAAGRDQFGQFNKDIYGSC